VIDLFDDPAKEKAKRTGRPNYHLSKGGRGLGTLNLAKKSALLMWGLR
jgi:hypothetical protein